MDLKSRSPQIQHLWSHQADILRAYFKEHKQRDIALELPTGTGKTLVGLLIAEWRRIALGERAVYLCPTRQLARQVGLRASEYGMKTHVLVGSQRDYPPAQFADYQAANNIAVTTYSGVFNVNPRISDPDVIVLDDAHAGENYIAKMWTISASRSGERELYDSLINLFSADLPSHFVAAAQDDKAAPDQRQTVELVPGPRVFERIAALEAQFETLPAKTEARYAWEKLKGHLGACSVFASWAEVVIRPWIPPALTHAPFAGAAQRVFMSATLGEAGELERISGIHKIYRIPVPKGWEQQSTGRRLFLAPDRSFVPDQYVPWLMTFLGEQKRALFLTQSGPALGAMEKMIERAKLPHAIMHSNDIEDSLDPFVTKEPAILALTGRYDGIDLPGDACRIIVIYGLPSSVNLQEEFLWSRLGLSNMLRDRIRTRITQAAGRCTRNATDFAVVVLVGPKLLDFVIKKDNQKLFHPEFRAELQFGMDNSETEDISVLTELSKLLLEGRPEWQQADADIIQRRTASTGEKPAFIATLRDLTGLEVEVGYDLWNASYDNALKGAATIVDRLSGDDLGAYRALWNYFCGCAGYALHKATRDESMKTAAAERFRRASQSVRGVPMFAKIAHEIGARQDPTPAAVNLEGIAAENIEKFLVEVGFIGPKFDKFVEAARASLQKTDAHLYERGLTSLGRMLGYRATKPAEQGAPDSMWELGNSYFALLEAKSDETAKDPVSVSTCRQAGGHKNWLSAVPFVPHDTSPTIVVITPRTTIEKAAIPHAAGLHHVTLDDVQKLFRDAAECLRAIRGKAADLDTAERLAVILDERKKWNLTHQETSSRLSVTQLSTLGLA